MASTTTTTVPAWQTIATAHRLKSTSKIPASWLLGDSILSTISSSSTQSVLAIPSTCGILTSREIEITEKYSAIELAEMLAKGQVSSVDVTTAFCKRAAIAGQLTNCLTETLFDEAIERAKYCDEYLLKEGKPIGPFHGLPISLKDSFNIKGIHSTIGYVSFITNGPCTSGSAIVSILLKLGAVLYVKTNIPQTLMTADSENNIFLRTLNPRSLNLTAGGSSGGEGALSALKGSILGIGTDIAGSIRIPAYCNGITGFKPSTRRVPYGGQTGPGRAGSWAILASAGPLCRSVGDAEFFMLSVLGEGNGVDAWEFDEGVLGVPWRDVGAVGEDGEGKKLRIGIWKEVKGIELLPTNERVFEEVGKRLVGSGVDVVEVGEGMGEGESGRVREGLMNEAMVVAFKMFSLDPKGTPFARIAASGEPIIPSIGTLNLEELKGFVPDLNAVWDLNVQAKKIKDEMRDLWIRERLDAIILPVHQSTAPKHDNYGAPPYTVLVNLLDAPSIAMPFLYSDPKLDRPYVRSSVEYSPAYDPSATGIPGGFQIMGRNMRDEELLAIAAFVGKVLKK